MRYISLFTHEGHGADPTEDEIAAMRKLIEEGLTSGWLIITEGVKWGSKGTRVRAKGGKISVVDGPFAEAKEVVGGYAILRASSKEEVLRLTERFLKVSGGEGTCEIHELFETPAGGKDPGGD